MKRLLAGKLAEDLACKYLKRKRYKVIERNFRCRIGEIDIIAIDKDEIVVVEVRSVQSASFCTPLESITPTKIKRIRKIAEFWLFKADLVEPQLRFDVLSIAYSNHSREITHIQDAF